MKWSLEISYKYKKNKFINLWFSNVVFKIVLLCFSWFPAKFFIPLIRDGTLNKIRKLKIVPISARTYTSSLLMLRGVVSFAIW